MEIKDLSYMNQHFKIKIEESDSTIDTTVIVHSTNAFIRGKVTGDYADIVDDINLFASGNHDSLNTSFMSEASIDQDGKFELNVSTSGHFSGFSVMVDKWQIPDGYVVIPDSNYMNVAPNDTTVSFTVHNSRGTISGKFTMTLPTEYFMAGVLAINSAQGIFLEAKREDDSTYFMKVPNGTYTVVGGYWGKDDTLIYHAEQMKV